MTQRYQLLSNQFTLFLEAIHQIEARRLEEVPAILDSLRTDKLTNPLVDRLVSGHSHLLQGFKALFEELDLDQAQKAFAAAQAQLAGIGNTAQYAEQCIKRLKELHEFTSSLHEMASVPGGIVQIAANEAPRAVDGFFIDRFEVSNKEYRQFMKFLVGKTLAKVRQLFPDEAIDEERFQRYAAPPASLQKNLNPEWPVEEVNYYQAQAFARWKKKSLFTLEEWWLAAKGSSDQKFRRQISHIHKAARFPTSVNRGGEVLGFAKMHSVHHLAGNVAEWCQVEKPGDPQALLVGGRYLDQNEQYFSGERRDRLSLDASRPGYGFRCILRPKEFFADLLPVQSQ